MPKKNSQTQEKQLGKTVAVFASSDVLGRRKLEAYIQSVLKYKLTSARAFRRSQAMVRHYKRIGDDKRKKKKIPVRRVARGLAPWGQGVKKKKKTSHPPPLENGAGGVADGAPGDAPAASALGTTPEDSNNRGCDYVADVLVVLGTD